MNPSFRDPSGHLVNVEGRILRVVAGADVPPLKRFLSLRTTQLLVEQGSLIATEELPSHNVPERVQAAGFVAAAAKQPDSAVFEHRRVRFVSYPYEWPAEMLHAAGCLTLDLFEAVLDDGFGLKDATPYNVLFEGAAPVFVDVLSFEPRDPCDLVWLAYGQFVRTFLLPLLLCKYRGLPPSTLLADRRDGIKPEEAWQILGTVRRWLPPALTLVTLPMLLARKRVGDDTVYAPRRVKDPEQARFILTSLIRRTRRLLRAVAPRQNRQSEWSRYPADNSYNREALQAKQQFVSQAIDELRPHRVLDVGCNTGDFSFECARRGASVVAIDEDEVVLGRLWTAARAQGLDVLPLRVDLARPSPATGWRNRECASFVERAAGSFDTVLMLAVVHHLLVTERIPLAEILSQLAELTSDTAVVEFVAPEDPMFRRISRGRDELFRDLNEGAFESACRSHFETLRRLPLPGMHRTIYLLRRKRADA